MDDEMRNVLIIKRGGVLAGFFIALILIIFLYKYIENNFSIVSEEIVKKEAVNNLVNLYIVQSDAGATTKYAYKYFLFDAKKDDSDFMRSIKDDIHPFLVTDDQHANVNIEDDKIKIVVNGRIYNFDNLGVYKLSTGIYHENVYLSSSPF